MYRTLSVAPDLEGRVILFAESNEGIFSHTITGSDEVRIESDASDMRVAAVSVDTTAVVRGWYLSGDYTEIEDGLIEFSNSSSTNNYPRYVTTPSSGNISVIDEHGSHEGTPSGENMKVKTSSYDACVGVRHTSTDSGYEFVGWTIDSLSSSGFEFASSGFRREYISGVGYRYYVDDSAGFDPQNALVIYDINSSTAITITAVYKKICTVEFDANGGTDAPQAITIAEGDSVVIPDEIPVYDTFPFLGWSLSADSETAEYAPGDSIVVTSNITLFAVWYGDIPNPPSPPSSGATDKMVYIAGVDSLVYIPTNGSLAFG